MVDTHFKLYSRSLVLSIRFLSLMISHTPQALVYAKEAHRLRSKLFDEKFKFSVDQQSEKSNGTTNVLLKVSSSLRDLQVRRSVGNEMWSCDSISWDMEKCYLSPWAILQCYLESTLQVWPVSSFHITSLF